MRAADVPQPLVKKSSPRLSPPPTESPAPGSYPGILPPEPRNPGTPEPRNPRNPGSPWNPPGVLRVESRADLENAPDAKGGDVQFSN